MRTGTTTRNNGLLGIVLFRSKWVRPSLGRDCFPCTDLTSKTNFFKEIALPITAVKKPTDIPIWFIPSFPVYSFHKHQQNPIMIMLANGIPLCFCLSSWYHAIQMCLHFSLNKPKSFTKALMTNLPNKPPFSTIKFLTSVKFHGDESWCWLQLKM
jgi:hypothetical protein